MRQFLSVLIAVLMFSTVSYGSQWTLDGTGYRYQNDDGNYQIGWRQDPDGKWYYLDDWDGYMLADATTPDGFYVAADGVWDGNPAAGKAVLDDVEYDCKTELTVTAYSSGPAATEVLEYPLPVTVYYNHSYENVYGGQIRIDGASISPAGVPYLNFRVKTDGGSYELTASCRYLFEDGSHLNATETVFAYCENGVTSASHHLLWRETANAQNRRAQLASATVCIEKGADR